MKFKKQIFVESMVGLFSFAVIAALFLLTVVLSQDSLFRKERPMEILFDHAMGLRVGDSVSARGVVVYSGDQIGVLGGLVLIDHGGGWVSAYGRLSRYNVVRGDSVQAGQVIGAVGDTGGASGSGIDVITAWIERITPAASSGVSAIVTLWGASTQSAMPMSRTSHANSA